jgi:hypothetical protein
VSQKGLSYVELVKLPHSRCLGLEPRFSPYKVEILCENEVTYSFSELEDVLKQTASESVKQDKATRAPRYGRLHVLETMQYVRA